LWLVVAIAAIVIPLAELAAAMAFAQAEPFNDFKDYYFAAKLIATGHSPYDLAALADMARREGVDLTIGTGYSYPLPFAVAMVPLTVLPLAGATLVFIAVSLVAFGAAVAFWLRRALVEAQRPRRLASVALLAGSYPPVFGSLFNGQANLLVVALFGWGVLVVVGRDSRAVFGSIAVGLAAVVKLVPAVVAVPLLLTGRGRSAAALIGAIASALLVATAIAPFGNAGSGRLVDLIAPDPFFTNQSINGFVSRLVLPSNVTSPVIAGRFDPLVVGLGLALAFGVVNVLLLVDARRRLGEREILLDALALAVVAAVIAAPKNSFWNQVFLLVPVGLLLLSEGRLAAIRGRDPVERLLLVTWFGAAVLQQALWVASPIPGGSGSALFTLAYSSALYGALALWLLFARRLFTRTSGMGDGLVSSVAGGSA
jgi:predicted outer membrane lipoprotein